MKRTLLVLLSLILFVPNFASAAPGGETNARDYIPAPAGTTLMLTYFKNITADSAYSNGKRVDGFNYSQNLGYFRVVHFDTLFGMPVDYQALGFFNSQELDIAGGGPSGTDLHKSGSGVMDPSLVTTLWPYANPSTKTWFGITQYVSIPVGEYNKNKVLNPGSNVWAFKEEIGLSQGIGDKVFFEVQPSVEFYTDNNDNTGGRLSKNPIFQLNTHLSYNITPKFFVSGDYVFQNGGATKVAGVSQNDYVNSHRLGASFNYKLADDVQLMLEYSRTVSTRNGADVGITGARFLYIF